ncbi:MAG: hypothetical protein ACFFCI_07580 [Promethearchaeota archaeon]
MKHLENLDFNEFIDQHTLLYGETDTNKTYLTSRFIQFLLESKGVPPKTISILDFAPKLTIFKNLKIGGKIQDFYEKSILCNNILFEGEIIPPRLKSSNKVELYQNAYYNFLNITKLLQIFEKNPTPILIINDISLYLHLGSINLLMRIIEKSDTFLGNTYYGTSIKRDFASKFSLREKLKVESLMRRVDKYYFTG